MICHTLTKDGPGEADACLHPAETSSAQTEQDSRGKPGRLQEVSHGRKRPSIFKVTSTRSYKVRDFQLDLHFTSFSSSVLRTSAEPTAARQQQTPISVSSRVTPTQIFFEHLRIISSSLQLLSILLFWNKWETKNNINQQKLLSADPGGNINSRSLETTAPGSGRRVTVLSAGDEALQAEKPHLWGTLCYIT